MISDGFSARVRVSSIGILAGLTGETRYDNLQIEMSGFINVCADAGFVAHEYDVVRKQTSVRILAKFGEESRACGVPNNLASLCIGVMNVRVMDESDSRRTCDLHADLRLTLPSDFFSHFLTLQEHFLEVTPSFYREPDRDVKKTKIQGFGSIASYITRIGFSPILPNIKEELMSSPLN